MGRRGAQSTWREGEAFLNIMLKISLFLLGPEANWQSQIFRPLHKVRGVRVDLILGITMFERAGPMAEKALPLDLASQTSLTNGARSMPLLPAWVG